ncbi:MAG: glucose-6-phosphate isomerase family protein [Catenisphaera adipataccumulans]|jgi:glucose-6-phosphate isomerase|uniref:glucose-6-phosphate isomerase family protein n=1 Tax=Catenisphaera adipataccumulans TaxID=700500 RepID=UPI003D91E3C7
MEVKNSELTFDWLSVPKGAHVIKSVKTYAQAKDFYLNEDRTIVDQTCMYEVYMVPAKPGSGHLNCGITILYPLLVAGECNMTRGHFHQDLNCEEYYRCQSGQGLLMLMDEKGTCWCERMQSGSLHHIDGHWAHRVINTGSEPLRFEAYWPADSGHDYDRVKKHPFPVRVFKEHDIISFKSVTGGVQ